MAVETNFFVLACAETVYNNGEVMIMTYMFNVTTWTELFSVACKEHVSFSHLIAERMLLSSL